MDFYNSKSNLFKKSNSKGKLLFHLEIEKGDFSIFERYEHKEVLQQHLKNYIFPFSSHTTLQSMVSYIFKNFKNKEETQAIDFFYDMIKKYNVDYNEDINSNYPETFHFNDKKIPIPLNLFTTFINYNFPEKKLKNLKIEIIDSVLNNTKLDDIIPDFVIQHIKDPDFLNKYLYKVKNDFPEKEISNKNLLKLESPELFLHFFKLKLQQDEETGFFDKNIFERFFTSYNDDVLLDVINNHSINLKKIIESSDYVRPEIIEMIINKYKKENFDFKTFNITFFKDFYRNSDLIKKLIEYGIDYKSSLKNNKHQYFYLENHIKTLINFDLWDFNTKNNDGDNYISLKTYNLLHEEDSYFVTFKKEFEELLSFLNKNGKINILDNLNFLQEADVLTKSIIYAVIIDEEKEIYNNILEKHFNNDLLNGVVSFINTNTTKETYNYRLSLLISNSLFLKTLPLKQNEEQHIQLLEQLKNTHIDFKELLIKVLNENKNEIYIDKYNKEHFKLITHILSDLNISFEDFHNTSQKMFEIIEKLKSKNDISMYEEDKTYNLLIDSLNNIDPQNQEEFLKIIIEKKQKVEKEIISSSLLEIEQQKTNKKRL